jgi:hypothetical protein
MTRRPRSAERSPPSSGGKAHQRRPKLSRDELYSLLIETGRTILREEGLGTGAESLTFKRVFERVEGDTGLRLTNASIIRRVWDNQADYQADVLTVIAADAGRVETSRTLEAVAPVFKDIDLSTVDARWDTLVELCRVAGQAAIETLTQSPNWPSWIGVWAVATVGDSDDRRSRIEQALLVGYQNTTDRFEEAYLSMAGLLGFRLRPGFTVRQFGVAVGAMTEGCALRQRVDASTMEGIMRPTGPHGEDRPWTLYAVGFEALVRQFLEIDPAWRPAPEG